MAIAQADSRVVVTEDKDFGQLAFQDGVFPPGLIRLALPGVTPNGKATRLLEVISAGEMQIWGAAIVVDPHRIRVRALS